MCDPISISMAAATAISAAGSVVQGVQARQQANYEAKVDDINRNMAVQARREAIDQGQIAQVRADRQASQVEGEQRVAAAGSGVDANYGTASSLATDAALTASENRQDIATNTDRTAMGYSLNADNYASQAVAAKARGRDALVNGLFSATGTILGGAAQVGKMRSSPGYGGGSGANAYGLKGAGNIY